MASVGFRWLDLLEKEFDKAFVDLDLEIVDFNFEEPEFVYNVRQKLCTLNSCFAQLTHKAQTIFQNSAKIEAELIHMRAELVESQSKRELLEKELHNLLLLLHSTQLSQTVSTTHINNNNKQEKNVNMNYIKPEMVNNIKKKIEDELNSSPTHITTRCKGKEAEELTYNKNLLEMAKLKTENNQLQIENGTLRNKILALNSEVYGAKLAAKYLDKELAGRIQQLQLLGREMRSDVRDKLWRQLESEILLQRHKTVVRECRRNSNNSESKRSPPKPPPPQPPEMNQTYGGELRTVVVKRKQGQGLGISITGGREHGVPILISELEANGPAAVSGQLFIGDAILSVNDRDLRQACHREAVDILKQQIEDCVLQVQYVAADDDDDTDNSLEEDAFNYRYKFFDTDVCNPNDYNKSSTSDLINTPTAPRTPESTSHEETSSGGDGGRTSRRTSAVKETTASSFVDCLLDESIVVGCLLDEPNPILTTNLTINDNNDNAITKQRNETNLIDLIDSNDSLNSVNYSSPMQTSCDPIDSELISNDLTSSNDSEVSKIDSEMSKNDFKTSEIDGKSTENNFKQNILSIETENDGIYAPTDTFFQDISDDDDVSNDEDDDFFANRSLNKRTTNNKKRKKNKQKMCKFLGVKTLQNIFSKYDGYSDLSSSSDFCEQADNFCDETDDFCEEADESETLLLSNTKQKTSTSAIARPMASVSEKSEFKLINTNDSTSILGTDEIVPEEAEAEPEKPEMETSQQFEQNIHTILTEMFTKNFPPNFEILRNNQTSSHCYQQNKQSLNNVNNNNTKKQLRIGKALRLCPNEATTNLTENERKEKLLARYVYNANSISTLDGVGDPDFGTPV